jgi:hypothetical protein
MKPIKFEKVSLADAKSVHEGKPQQPKVDDWSIRRSARNQHEPLSEATTAWMRQLPDDVRPLELAERFPRIANRICILWIDQVRCASYLADLLIDRRRDRQGFPAAIAKEIADLTVHQARSGPVGRPWTEAL